MVEAIRVAAAALGSLLQAADVSAWPGEACVRLAGDLARIEKAAGAVRAMAAARGAACGAHRASGFDSADDWAAALTGSSLHQARSELTTGARLADCPVTRHAAAGGELSLGQAGEIARTERERPGSESDLVALSRSSNRSQLADECRRRRHDGVDRKKLTADQHALRSFRSWNDGDGMVCGQFRLEPAVGVALLARVQAEADRVHRAARQSGSDEGWAAHAADAVVAMLGGGVVSGRSKRSRRADVVFVIDLETFRSGERAGSVCHIVGGGPVDVDVVREVARDAFLKVVFHDGVDIQRVSHVGRYIPAELRTALELGRPPNFEGVACSGCGRRFHLQWDHLQPVCADGVTSYANEDAKCWDCHAAKSAAERAAGMYGRRERRVPSAASGRRKAGGEAGGGECN